MKTDEFEKLIGEKGTVVYLEVALATIVANISNIESAMTKTMVLLEQKGMSAEQAKIVCDIFLKSIKPIRAQMPKIN